MTPAVVDLLETIHVENNQAELPALAASTLPAVSQAIEKQRAIREAGQRVVCRAMHEITHLIVGGMEHRSSDHTTHQFKQGQIGIIECVATARVRAEDADRLVLVTQRYDDHRADAYL